MVDMYDSLIKIAVSRYLAGADWRIYKAQLLQESGLNSHAVNSGSGASGIAQFMPATWGDMIDQLGFESGASVFDAELSIQAGAYYMSKMSNSWTSKRPKVDRYALALASYNCGLGTMLKAQRSAGGANEYHKIIRGLSQNNTETPNYVRNIFSLFNSMLFYGK